MSIPSFSKVFTSHCILATSVLIAALASSGCGSSSESTSLSYDFTSNGCPTGKQTFSDMASYCAGLKNDAQNNYCAKDIREKTYAERCQPAAAAPLPDQASDQNGATLKSAGQSSGGLQAPLEQFGTIPGPKPLTAVEQADVDAKSRPSFVTLKAHAEGRLTPAPRSSGGKMITTLEGKIVILATMPGIGGRTLNLMGARRVQIVKPELGSCALHVKNFTNSAYAANHQTIGFSLIGSDAIDTANQDACLVKLSTMAMAGFSVEFENVRIGGPLSDVIVPTVRLEVAPAASM